MPSGRRPVPVREDGINTTNLSKEFTMTRKLIAFLASIALAAPVLGAQQSKAPAPKASGQVATKKDTTKTDSTKKTASKSKGKGKTSSKGKAAAKDTSKTKKP
jgi:hypothetical protein